MLTRLDLIGFKSFADRTRFDFAPGVTAVVGPNGSGKSNIVDAVRWVLGEQSAKSLRGGEMADVIFNGSSTRKAVGVAEVTITFDNRRKALSNDADEVTVSRRVYRDGVGEYLINGQLARLKDVKELFLGSGAGAGAYSIIEQGRVEALLTASTKDRRQIFEEAAGISRFKARKLETLRKLDRVEADLTRVRDILAELDKQLRTLQLQASKAEKYREYSDRLRALRVGSGSKEYAALGTSLAAEREALAAERTTLAGVQSRATSGEAELKAVEWELGRADDGLRHQSARLGEAKQQLAGHEATAKADRTSAASFEADALRIGTQRADLARRVRTLEADLAAVSADRDAAAAALDGGVAAAANATEAVAAAERRAADLARDAQAARDEQFELVDRHARLRSAADATAALLDRQRKDLERKKAEAETTAGKHDTLAAALDSLSKTDADLRDRLELARTAHAGYSRARDSLRAQADATQPSLDALRDRRSVLRGRVDLLDNLDRVYDGVGAGVRSVAERVASDSSFRILGLVADLLSVPRDVAPLIDIALGELAQRFVVPDAATMDSTLAALGELPGRVGFVPLAADGPPPLPPETPPPFGTVAASHLVRGDLPGLVERLLGAVMIVDSLPDAVRLTRTWPGYRAVARTGELVEPDGTVVAGPVHATVGLLSRKSELRELRDEWAAVDARTRETEAEQARLRTAAEAYDRPIREREAELATLGGEAGTLREQLLRQREALSQLADRVERLVRESDLVAFEVKQAEQQFADLTERAAKADDDAKAVIGRLKETDAALAAAEAERQARQRDDTEAQVQLSRRKEQLAALNARVDGADATLRQRKVEAVNLASEERAARGRALAATLAALRATAAAADAYREKEDREKSIADLAARREAFGGERARLRTLLAEGRAALLAAQEAVHARDLAVQSLVTRRDALAERIREDYQLDLESYATTELPGDAPDPAAEIESLRQKIAKLGSVNPEAIDELRDVETRATALHAQVADLTEGRRKLVEIIARIDADSRKLFTDTLAAVKVHFQELFRKLFGGGMADIVLDDETDVLDAGIDVIARPPGKDLRSISLLSGGEKTMTAVALLLAIFRNRPSPFCLLDEVDAALDEANTARLAGVVREFLDRSQFIVITHKKRTMAAADVLYGITMQESGVSKQVAVRFEDWPDEQDEPASAAA
jgi:chromosome segregation protein